MHILSSLFRIALLCCIWTSLSATTWVTDKVRDPITKRRVAVAQPASSGGYIYGWPEKSDLVFWPYTDPQWLWFNPKSGYIAFGDDFEELTREQRSQLKAWLKDNYDRNSPPDSRVSLLRWAEMVYANRGMDETFWCHYYRLMAFETRDDPKTSLDYVSKARPLLVKQLETTGDSGSRMEALYLLSEYDRRLGNESSSASYLEELDSFDAPENLAGFKDYLLDIAKEQRAKPMPPGS